MNIKLLAAIPLTALVLAACGSEAGELDLPSSVPTDSSNSSTTASETDDEDLVDEDLVDEDPEGMAPEENPDLEDEGIDPSLGSKKDQRKTEKNEKLLEGIDPKLLDGPYSAYLNTDEPVNPKLGEVVNPISLPAKGTFSKKEVAQAVDLILGVSQRLKTNEQIVVNGRGSQVIPDLIAPFVTKKGMETILKGDRTANNLYRKDAGPKSTRYWLRFIPAQECSSLNRVCTHIPEHWGVFNERIGWFTAGDDIEGVRIFLAEIYDMSQEKDGAPHYGQMGSEAYYTVIRNPDPTAKNKLLLHNIEPVSFYTQIDPVSPEAAEEADKKEKD